MHNRNFQKILKRIIENPSIIYYILIGLKFKLISHYNKKIKIGEKCVIIGNPIVDLNRYSKLEIGNGVTLRSKNKGYHGLLSNKVKLMCDKNAIISIGNNTRIYGSCIHASKNIKIGERCLIASNSLIIDRNGHDLSMEKPENRINTYGISSRIIIENDVWIGTNSVILPGTYIAKGSVVMANSVVKGVFKEKCIIAGVPAKILKEYK